MFTFCLDCLLFCAVFLLTIIATLPFATTCTLHSKQRSMNYDKRQRQTDRQTTDRQTTDRRQTDRRQTEQHYEPLSCFFGLSFSPSCCCAANKFARYSRRGLKSGSSIWLTISCDICRSRYPSLYKKNRISSTQTHYQGKLLTFLSVLLYLF